MSDVGELDLVALPAFGGLGLLVGTQHSFKCGWQRGRSRNKTPSATHREGVVTVVVVVFG